MTTKQCHSMAKHSKCDRFKTMFIISIIKPNCNLFFLFFLFASDFVACVQSQPCHWRNIKSVTKRDVSNANKTIANEVAENGKKEKSVSDNVSLFQSLRVLQDGEGDDFSSAVPSKYLSTFYDDFFFVFNVFNFPCGIDDFVRAICLCLILCHWHDKRIISGTTKSSRMFEWREKKQTINKRLHGLIENSI